MRLPFDDPELISDTKAVLRDLQPRQRTILDTESNRTFTRRILPYRTEDHRIMGVVLTLTDVTELADARRKAEEQLALNQLLYASAPVGLAYVDRQLLVQRINDRLAGLTGSSAEYSIGKKVEQAFPAELASSIEQNRELVVKDGLGLNQANA
jgi:two-component system CheB/CheR fusion protein